MNDSIKEQLDILQEGIQKDVTLVADFFDVDTPLGEYAAEVQSYEAPAVHKERQQLLKSVIQKKLSAVFTDEELVAGNIDWETDLKLNIVDHHWFLNHPILMSTNIIANMDQFLVDDPKGVIVLTDSGVPMNNFFFKRGFQIHGEQLNVFPSRQRHQMAYAGGVKEDFPLLEKAKMKDVFSEDDMTLLQSVEQKLSAIAQEENVTDFLTQVDRSNHWMWKQLFAEDIRDTVPDVFYISNEEIAVEMLREYLQEENSLWYKVLCEPEMRQHILSTFNGVIGCWNDSSDVGTYFFWGLNEKGEALRMVIDGNAIISTDERYPLRVELTPEGIMNALYEKQIYASMFVVYGISIFTCGVKPLVGFGSMNYQTHMKKQWVEALKERMPEEAALMGAIPTNGFIGGPKVTFAREGESYKDLYAFDIMRMGGFSKHYIESLKQVSFNAVLTPALIDIYDSYVRPENKQDITVTSGELMGEPFAWLQ